MVTVNTRDIVVNSWRYYLTYLKALTTIIDSNFVLNEAYLTKVNPENSKRSP